DVPMSVELKLEVWDSPNSAGVVIDAVRCAKLAVDRGISGTLEGPSAYFMKSPPVQYPDDEARELVEAFIRGDSRAALPTPAAAGRREGAAEPPWLGSEAPPLPVSAPLSIARVPPHPGPARDDVAQHVAAQAGALARRGHGVTLLAPGTGREHLAEGRARLA